MEASKYNDTIQVASQETTQPAFSEMNRRLPEIATQFNTSINHLAIFNFRLFPNEYMNTEERDPIVHAIGPLEGLPFIKTSRLNAARRGIGWGTLFYQSRRDENLKYATYTAHGQWGDMVYIIVPKDKVLRLWYLAREANKQANEITNPPILADGLLDKIIQNTIGFLQKSRMIEKYGVRIKRGIILEGDPGNGKTMACRHIQKLCSQNGYDWGVITSSDIDSAYDDGALCDLMQQYVVSFFDDIDIQYLDRSKGNGKIACSLLTAMDGMYEKGHLVRIFTTNERIDSLDRAFTRPGRIDSMITLSAPDDKLRRKLVDERWPEEIRMNIDVNQLINQSDNFSFAELEAIRTLLVTEKVVNGGEWNLNKAFQDFNERQQDSKKGEVGFNK